MNVLRGRYTDTRRRVPKWTSSAPKVIYSLSPQEILSVYVLLLRYAYVHQPLAFKYRLRDDGYVRTIVIDSSDWTQPRSATSGEMWHDLHNTALADVSDGEQRSFFETHLERFPNTCYRRAQKKKRPKSVCRNTFVSVNNRYCFRFQCCSKHSPKCNVNNRYKSKCIRF